MTEEKKTELSTVQVVIYDRPADYPNGFLVRNWVIKAGMTIPGKVLGHSLATLDEARALVPEGMYCLGRMPDDEPQIVEVWI